MKIRLIKEVLGAEVIEGKRRLENSVDHVYASDLMSDVLAFGKPNSILLTGLATQQAIISAHMAEFKGVVLIRGKKPENGSGRFAKDNQMVLLSTNLDMYDSCVKINSIRKSKVKQSPQITVKQKREEILLNREFTIKGNDFANAGMVSTEIKAILKKIGLNPLLIRRVAISAYEGEMNVVMHARSGKVKLMVSPKFIQILINDEGNGIPNIELAMTKGFTTATEEMRAMGFGSGMGLPNIKKNSDEMHIESTVEQGTQLEIKFLINQ